MTSGSVLQRTTFSCLHAIAAILVLSCGSKLPKLRQQLNDPDPATRIAAIQALAEAKDTGSVPMIVDLLQDPAPDVRKAAAIGLGKTGDRRAAQPLAEFYDKEQLADVRNAGIQALVRLSSYSIAPLIGLLGSIRPAVRLGAARALGRLGARRAVGPLMSLLRDRDTDVRIAAMFALRQIGDERGLDAVESMVQDTNPDVEGAAERALSGEGYLEQLNRARRKIRQLPYP